MAEIKEVYHRLLCDNCQKAISPIAGSKPEARDLAKHIGWIIYDGKACCVSCFYRLDAEQQIRMMQDKD